MKYSVELCLRLLCYSSQDMLDTIITAYVDLPDSSSVYSHGRLYFIPNTPSTAASNLKLIAPCNGKTYQLLDAQYAATWLQTCTAPCIKATPQYSQCVLLV